ncbi:phosphoinositide 3-kinase regulatory subunit 6 [Platysternon megacephalum]|uniref:Phosphoinositide 3-kinase regulatory subunit 6 n=1 Tax=Platysternon megacephalum TaxID=55544 RepID=A0A4D9ED15_9SAUR|nr:phosphoinositide 3-kinase regulatory subunit 6 [Platysternon megacephalum]
MAVPACPRRVPARLPVDRTLLHCLARRPLAPSPAASAGAAASATCARRAGLFRRSRRKELIAPLPMGQLGAALPWLRLSEGDEGTSQARAPRPANAAVSSVTCPCLEG